MIFPIWLELLCLMENRIALARAFLLLVVTPTSSSLAHPNGAKTVVELLG